MQWRTSSSLCPQEKEELIIANEYSTAEIAANAPRYRRKSSTFIDGIHDVAEPGDMAPAQLYSTMSGRLFHSGRIAIVMVGLPARGKT
jgi:6-phosphofructo-2-kinase / fructose-2,6-biphosphatase 4